MDVCFIKFIVTITSLTHAIICRALFHSIEVIDREDHFHLPSRHTHTHTHTRQMASFVRTRMCLAIVRSNTLLLRGDRAMNWRRRAPDDGVAARAALTIRVQ